MKIIKSTQSPESPLSHKTYYMGSLENSTVWGFRSFHLPIFIYSPSFSFFLPQELTWPTVSLSVHLGYRQQIREREMSVKAFPSLSCCITMVRSVPWQRSELTPHAYFHTAVFLASSIWLGLSCCATLGSAIYLKISQMPRALETAHLLNS